MKRTPESVWKVELREICRILKDNGIDIKKIHTKKTTLDGKIAPTILKDIKEDGIDVIKVIKKNGLDENYPIGYYISRYRKAYKGTAGNLTKEEREEGEILGIVTKPNENTLAPIFKGGKISQFHLDFIDGILDKILNGQINTKEALELLRQASIDNSETVIEDTGSIKRCVKMLLKDKPEELKAYYEMVKRNSGKRNPFKGNIGRPKIGLYYEREKQFEQKLIVDYLPLILNGKTTFDMISQELSCSHHTINRVIENFFIQNNDLEGLANYQRAKRYNRGVSIERREAASNKRKEVANYNVVTNKEFILLPPEQQELQLIMKIKLEKLKEESSNTSTRRMVLISEDAIKGKINSIMNYFRSKNDPNLDKVYFTDEDIRYMIFRYPTLINRTNETLDKKLNVLTSYDSIDNETAYGMIKSFPAIMGYEASRTRGQLDLLDKEGLIDVVITNPNKLMLSINLMYALIQYAKERHHTVDLRSINRSNICCYTNRLTTLFSTK